MLFLDRMSMKVEDVLSTAISRVLGSWTSYQLALQIQMGGSLTNDKANWFEYTLINHLNKQKTIYLDELCDWIDDILFDDFNLILEDGSSQLIAQLLIKLINALRSNDIIAFNALIDTLPSEAAVKDATKRSQMSTTINEDHSSSDEEETIVDNKEETVADNNTSTIILNGDDRIEEDDGWTLITKRR